MSFDYQSVLRKYGVVPEKKLGQNFLLSEDVLQGIVEFSGVSEDEHVLEIGPGTGFLTQELLQKSKKVTGVEYSDRMCEILTDRFADHQKFNLICGDVLDLHVPKIFCGIDKPKNRVVGEYIVVANIPYYITGKIIRFFLENYCTPSRMYFLVQKEVAQRLASHKNKESILSLTAQFYAEIQYGFDVPKEHFFPVPQVDSAVVGFVIKNHLPDVDQKYFFRLVRGVFKHKRKKISNGLLSVFAGDEQRVKVVLSAAGIEDHRRPENVSFDEFILLAQAWEAVEK